MLTFIYNVKIDCCHQGIYFVYKNNFVYCFLECPDKILAKQILTNYSNNNDDLITDLHWKLYERQWSILFILKCVVYYI